MDELWQANYGKDGVIPPFHNGKGGPLTERLGLIMRASCPTAGKNKERNGLVCAQRRSASVQYLTRGKNSSLSQLELSSFQVTDKLASDAGERRWRSMAASRRVGEVAEGRRRALGRGWCDWSHLPWPGRSGCHRWTWSTTYWTSGDRQPCVVSHSTTTSQRRRVSTEW